MAGLPFTPEAASPIAATIEGFTTGLIKGEEQRLANQRRVGAVMFEEAKRNPGIWDDPTAAKAIEAYVGGKEAFQVMKNAYQNQDALVESYNQAVSLGLVPAEEQQQIAQKEEERRGVIAANQPPPESGFRSMTRGLLRSLPGVGPIAQMAVPPPEAPPQQPVPPSPYTGMRERLVREAPSRGASVTQTTEGKTSVTQQGFTPAQIDERRIAVAIANRRAELIAHGLGEVDANETAAREIVGSSERAGMLIPKWAREVSDARGKLARDRATKEMQKQLDLAYAPRIAEAGAEAGAIGKARGQAEAALQGQTVVRLPSGQIMPINDPNEPIYIQQGDQTLGPFDPKTLGNVSTVPLSQVPGLAEQSSAGTVTAAATGVQGAIDLGKNPSKAQIAQVALAEPGYDLILSPSGTLVAVPLGANLPGSVSPGAIAQGPEAIKQLDALSAQMDRFATDKTFAKAFPSEAELGRVGGRTVGWLQSWVRGVTDPAPVLQKRGEIRRFGFNMARILGSNSQLSDRERMDALTATWERVANGTATREMLREAIKGTRELMSDLDARRKGKTPPPRGALGGNAPTTPTGSYAGATTPAPAGTPAPTGTPPPAGNTIDLGDGFTMTIE